MNTNIHKRAHVHTNAHTHKHTCTCKNTYKPAEDLYDFEHKKMQLQLEIL